MALVREGYTDAELREEVAHDERLPSAGAWTEPVPGVLYGNPVVITVEIDSGEICGIEKVAWEDGHEERFERGDGDWEALVDIVANELPTYPWA